MVSNPVSFAGSLTINLSGTTLSGAIWTAILCTLALIFKIKASDDKQILTNSTTKVGKSTKEPTKSNKSQEITNWQQKLNAAVQDINHEESIKRWSGWREFRIVDKQVECDDKSICSFYLAPFDNQTLPRFFPGQFLTFKLPNIPDQNKAVTRCYSLSDSFSNDHYRVSIKRQPSPKGQADIPPGVSSNFFHDKLNIGDIVQVKAPAGHFYLQEHNAKGVVLIAGGVGVTPITSMAKHLAKANSQRPIHIFYGAANAKQLALLPELQDAVNQLTNANITVCLSRQDDASITVSDLYKGRVSVQLFKQRLPSSNFEYYLCGPPPFMETIVSDLYDWGVPEKDVYFEAFGPASVKKKTNAISSESFKVQYHDTGRELDWDGSADSLLELTENNDIDIASGCRMGNCGACMTKIIDGTVMYPNGNPGCEDLDAGSCLPCVAVPSSNITLEA
jgi:ferredoxin-NADP reductase